MSVGQLPVIARGLIPDERFTGCRITVMDANPDMSQERARGCVLLPRLPGGRAQNGARRPELARVRRA